MLIQYHARGKEGLTQEELRIIPFYTGDETLNDVLTNKKSLDMLWLEILLNDHIAWEDYLDVSEINIAYEKACVWYSNFKTMVDSLAGRRPLRICKGKIDEREYRKFLEALNFVSS